MKWMISVLVVALGMFALFSCGRPNTSEFVQQAAMGDLYEVEAGKIAIAQGQTDAVKAFGQQMIDAHTKTTEQLKKIVQSENIEVRLPTELDKKRESRIADLKSATPADFDETYAKQQLKMIGQAARLFAAYIKYGDNPALKQFATSTRPMILDHLQEAKKLTGRVAGAKATVP